VGIINKVKNLFVGDPKPPTAGEFVKAYDEAGHQLFVPKEEWRQKVLPAQLKKNWGHADRLFCDISFAVQDGFFPEVLEAVRHLVEIDANRERSATLCGVVLMKVGRLDEAERLLKDHLQKTGESGVVLTNLAKIYAEQGKKADSELTLRHALKIDPNQDNAIGWLMAIANARGGEAEIKKTLEEYTRVAGSFRPQLWLARYALEGKDVPRAVAIYQGLLAKADLPGDVLMMISGDLGRNGCLAEVVELVAPRYDPQRHGPACGFNLLDTYLQQNDWARGLELAQQMQRQRWIPFNDRLAQYHDAFQKIKAGQG
jgi:lipopolysaccharide biosynthesis regulator YciM